MQQKELSAHDKTKILCYVRQLLEARLKGGAEPELEVEPEVLSRKCGLFVTLKINERLRGCIGHIVAQDPLRQSLRDMTFAAAFHDPRFPPLVLSELKDLKIHVSLLTEPVAIKSYKDIRTGTDGIIVSRGWKKGVYLPEVAIETGWDSKTFFESCALEKAGLTGPELSDATIEVFQTEGFEE